MIEILHIMPIIKYLNIKIFEISNIGSITTERIYG